jgi:hypothetical protein
MPFHKSSLRIYLIAGLASLALLLTLMPLSLRAQTEPVQYFPETGHTVRGEFLDYFNQHGGLRIFGYPITEQFSLNGRMVQYFQRGRLEFYPENQAPQRVQLGLLGEELGKKMPAGAALGPNTYYQRFYTQTSHTVAYAFLNFFDSNGGVGIFGYPISDYGPENGKGRIVQYFQRGKMEWYPELATEQRVQLADLGSIHFDLMAAQGKLDPALKKPVPSGQIISVPLSLKVSATTKYAITSRRFNQTLFVYVTDQTNMPVKDADVSFTTEDATGLKTYVLPKTDADGFTSYRFDVGAFRPAQTVFIEVTATFNGVTGTDQTSFFTWF